MHEVRVYDKSGNLKKVISVQALNKRSKQQIDNPSLFRKNPRNTKTAKKAADLAQPLD